MEAVYPAHPFCPGLMVPLASLQELILTLRWGLCVTQWQQWEEIYGQEPYLWKVSKAGGWVALGTLMLWLPRGRWA